MPRCLKPAMKPCSGWRTLERFKRMIAARRERNWKMWSIIFSTIQKLKGRASGQKSSTMWSHGLPEAIESGSAIQIGFELKEFHSGIRNFPCLLLCVIISVIIVWTNWSNFWGNNNIDIIYYFVISANFTKEELCCSSLHENCCELWSLVYRRICYCLPTEQIWL